MLTVHRTLLQIYYCQDLTQEQIATQLGIKQYQVSRQLGRIRRSLLQEVDPLESGNTAYFAHPGCSGFHEPHPRRVAAPTDCTMQGRETP